MNSVLQPDIASLLDRVIKRIEIFNNEAEIVEEKSKVSFTGEDGVS